MAMFRQQSPAQPCNWSFENERKSCWLSSVPCAIWQRLKKKGLEH